MTKRTYLLAALAFTVVFSAPLVAEEAPAPESTDEVAAAEKQEPTIYTVVPRDTLWDISKRFLNDPFKWPRIWSINPGIRNPDLIYPGDIVRITPDGIEIIGRKEAEPEAAKELPVVTVEPEGEEIVTLEPEPEEVKKEEPKKASISSYSVERRGFLTDKELEASGAILKAKEDKLLLGDRDDVFITLKDGNEIKEGDRYTIFVVGKEITHPVTEKRLGNIVEVLGSLTVTKPGDVVEARIDTSYREILAGARLMAFREPVNEVEITGADTGVSGFVVTALEGKENLASGDVIYIDRGTSDGLKKGNVMLVYRLRPSVEDPLSRKKKVELPPVELGRLVVVDPGENTSACVVISSLKVITRGDRVTTAGQQ